MLYAGLMLTADGPKLIEYNVRFGDPECQVLMMRLDDDLLDLMLAAAEGRLAEHAAPRFSDRNAMTVVIAAERSEEQTSELQSLIRISYAVFCLTKKTKNNKT